MNKYQPYYNKIRLGHIVREPNNSGNVVNGPIKYDQLDHSLPFHDHIEEFISKVIEMTSKISKNIKENKSRDRSESAEKKFNLEWTPYKDLTDLLNCWYDS